MASVQKWSFQSLQIGCTETSQRFQKKRHRNPPCTSESSFSNILSKDFRNGDKPPLFFPSLVCYCFVPAGRKVGRGRGDGGGELGSEEKWLALPSSDWPFIKGGLLLKTAEDGWNRSQGSQFPKKRLNRDFCVSFRHYPKCSYRFRKDHSYSIGFEEMN